LARYIIGSNVTVGGVPYYRDQVAELTSAQASAVTGAGGKLRAANNPLSVTAPRQAVPPTTCRRGDRRQQFELGTQMALTRYVVTADVTVPAGTFTPDAATGLRFGTGSWAGASGAWSDGIPASVPTFTAGQVIEFDPATTAGAALQSAIGAGNLRAYAPTRLRAWPG
jgi:hypothetical protein